MPFPPKKLKQFVKSQNKSPMHADEDDDKPEAYGKSDADIAREVGAKVQDGEVDAHLMKLMDDFDPKHNPPSWVADEDIWERAKEAVDPEGKGADEYDEPFAVVAHVYKQMGGGVK